MKVAFADVTKYASVKSHFRNQKAFFEKNEKVKLSEALEALTKPDAQNYLDGQKVALMTWAIAYIGEEAERLRLHIYHQALEQIATERLVLQEESRLASWKSIYAQLQYA
ncbi:GTPase OS=Lysinibacillus sphaericus OX=1421 GN=LS41612_14650 PE=4 SV=1 [Lysinibacillus sphaericus]